MRAPFTNYQAGLRSAALLTTSLLAAALLSGCMVGPDFSTPASDTASSYRNTGNQVQAAPVADAAWWENFNDPDLNRLIQLGYQNNLTLQVAGLRVLQARAQLAAAVGNLYPQQQALSGSYQYEQLSDASPSHVPGTQDNFHIASLGFSASWELDFWGKYRRAVQADDAAFLGSIAGYRAALVTLTAQIAQSYVSIRTLQSQIQVAQSNVRVQTEGLRIATAQFNAGETSMLDVQQAQTQLSLTQASIPGLVAQLGQVEDALGVLLGTTPDKVPALLTGDSGIPVPPAGVTVGIPKDLLRQRPDVQQAELAAASQSALLGVAKAQLYPAFSLSGTFGYESSDRTGASLGDLFQWSSRAINFGPSVQIPIFNYGQLTNQVRAQDAAFQQSIVAYQNTVLQAQQEVQDGITNYTQAVQAVATLTQANQSAVQSENLAMVRYRDGQSNYTTVLSAEQAQLQVQNSLAIATGNVPQTLIALYQALGGGWQISNGHDVVPEATEQQMRQRTNWGGLLSPPAHAAPTTHGQQIEQTYLPDW